MNTGQAHKPRAVRATRKRAILDLFAGMVAERGYDQTSIGDVAAELGISKGTIVHHFGSKEALLEQVHREFMHRRLREGREIISRVTAPTEQLAAMIYCLVLVYREDRDAALTFTREIVRYSASAEMVGVKVLRHEYFELIRSIIQRGMDDADFRADDSELITLQVFGMCNWGWTWIRPNGDHSIEQIATTFTRTLLRGLTAHPEIDIDIDEGAKLAMLVRRIVRESARQTVAES